MGELKGASTFNGKNIEYYITSLINQTKTINIESEEIKSTSELDYINENILSKIKNELPKNSILLVELDAGYRMYLIDNDGNAKLIKSPISLGAVYDELETTKTDIQQDIEKAKTVMYTEANDLANAAAKKVQDQLNIYAIKVDVEDQINAQAIRITNLENTKLNKQTNVTTNAIAKFGQNGNSLSNTGIIIDNDNNIQIPNSFVQGVKGVKVFNGNSNQFLKGDGSLDNTTYLDKDTFNNRLNNYLTSTQAAELYATNAHSHDNYQPKGNYVQSITMNNEDPKTPDQNGNLDLGEIIGQPGAQGTQGVQGIKGTSGNNGIQGANGIQGTQGVKGQSIQGTRGNQGISGNNGIQGVQGVRGQSIQGTQGIQGQSIQGAKGESGATGPQGPAGPAGTGGSGSVINIKPNWNANQGDDSEILNKPNIPYNANWEDKQDKLVSGTNIKKIRYSRDNTNTNFNSIDLIGNGSIDFSKVAFTGEYNDLKNTPNSEKYTKIFSKTADVKSSGAEYIDKDSIQRVVYNTIITSSGDPDRNIADDSYKDRFIQNVVDGYHSIALGWGCQIGGLRPELPINGKSYDGNHSLADGKWVSVRGDFSHGSGYLTEVIGDYAFGGGFNENSNYTTNAIMGNYSLGYGRNVQTFNNGEIAFGNYNKSKTISELRRPHIDSGELAYDNYNNPWKIIDFYNVYLNSFENNIDDDFEDIISGKTYNYEYDESQDFEPSYGENGASNNYTSFIKNVITKNCKILNKRNIQNESEFLIYIIHHLNVYKSIYTYKYQSESWYSEGNPGSIDLSGSIVGVIAQKCQTDGTPIDDEYDFFVWGPNSLYYEHEPITMLSIGNGAPLLYGDENDQEDNYKRSNLFEITNDGNVYYDNGKKNLFELENNVKNISNNLSQNVTNIASTFLTSSKYNQDKLECDNIYSKFFGIEDNQYDDYFNKYLVIPINNEIPSPFIINNSEIIKDNIILFINENELNYLKRTIIIDSTCYTNNQGIKIYFLSTKNGENLKYNICINHIDDQENTFDITADNGDNIYYMNLFKTEDIDYMYKIDIEIMNNICFIDTKGYFQNGQFNY